MIKSNSDAYSFSKVFFPLLLLLAGTGLIIYSVPGDGKNIPNAVGLLLVLIGTIWVKIVRSRHSR
jgi:hypothetical protein